MTCAVEQRRRGEHAAAILQARPQGEFQQALLVV